MKQFSLLLFIILLLTACGHKEAPTGGKRDTEKPKIIAITPAEYSDISKLENIEIVFSKPIERSSIKTGLHIFPPILEKDFDWAGAILKINWQEDLQDSTNYFLSFNTNIKGEHDNYLDRNYTFTFSSGKVEESTISGTISYEKAEDRGKEVTLALSTADSVNIFTKKITEHTFRLENLNRTAHILQAYIDKNENHSFNPNSEPYAYRFVPRQKMATINLELTYRDTTKPKVDNIQVLSKDKLQIKLSEPASKFAELNIYTADSLQTALPVTASSLEKADIFVLTSQMDTLKYSAEILKLQDLKQNIRQRQVVEFQGVVKPDTLAPKVVDFWPVDGSSIKQLLPKIDYKFDEIILKKDIKAELTEVETGKNIPLHIIGSPARFLQFQPQKPLQNYSSYSFQLQVADKNGNIRKVEPITFIPIVR